MVFTGWVPSVRTFLGLTASDSFSPKHRLGANHRANTRTQRANERGTCAHAPCPALPPRDENLSAGMVCFDVKGMKPEEGVEALLAQRIVASTTPYRVSYARLACNIVNTPQEVETVLRAIRELA